MARFIVIGPDGIPIRPAAFGSRAAAERGLREFVARFEIRGYYAGVDGKLPIDAIASHCSIEETDTSGSQRRCR